MSRLLWQLQTSAIVMFLWLILALRYKETSPMSSHGHSRIVQGPHANSSFFVWTGDLVSPPVHDVSFKKFYNEFSDVQISDKEPYWPLSWEAFKDALNWAGRWGVDGVVLVGGSDQFTHSASDAGPLINFNLQDIPGIHGDRWCFNTSVTPVNLVERLTTHPSISHSFDLLKLDFDGYECDVMESVLHAGFRPKIIVIELNSIWVPPIKFSLRYSPHWQYGTGQPFLHGCSLQYAASFLQAHGYTLVQYAAWDGWFVRTDLVMGSVLQSVTSISVLSHFVFGNPKLWTGLGGGSFSMYMDEWITLGKADPRLAIERVLANVSKRMDAKFPFLLSYEISN